MKWPGFQIEEDVELKDIILMRDHGIPRRILYPNGVSYPLEPIPGRSDVARCPTYRHGALVIDLRTGEGFMPHDEHLRWDIAKYRCLDCEIGADNYKAECTQSH
jgi:hypothetical protein